jgi:hypothetical protein
VTLKGVLLAVSVPFVGVTCSHPGESDVAVKTDDPLLTLALRIWLVGDVEPI